MTAKVMTFNRDEIDKLRIVIHEDDSNREATRLLPQEEVWGESNLVPYDAEEAGGSVRDMQEDAQCQVAARGPQPQDRADEGPPMLAVQHRATTL